MEYSLEQLKAMAVKLGVTYHISIGSEKLMEKLQDAVVDQDTTIEEVADKCGFIMHASTPTTQAKSSVPLDGSEVERLKSLTFKTVSEKQHKISEVERQKEAMRLVRCIIRTNDPNKNSYSSEIFSVQNSVTGEVKKCIPFNVPVHIPKIMFNMIKEKKVQRFKEVRKPNGLVEKSAYLTDAYNIEVLPPITREELEAIKKKQLAEGFDKE